MPIQVDGFVLQDDPTIYVCSLPGRWLLTHSTPSWRIKDPIKGFQRVVNEQRAKDIAAAVLNRGRSFPNAIVLATDRSDFKMDVCSLIIPDNARFLVVDGQHRVWAQQFAQRSARYSCMIHMDLTEVDMARLFLEINDTQKRVPSSLRWDLVRLVRDEVDESTLEAAELTYDLATQEDSPFYQRIDLTGEQRQIPLKQGSVAPAVKSLIRNRTLQREPYEVHYQLIVNFFSAVREIDSDRWRSGDTPLQQARVIRALVRLLPDLVATIGKTPKQLGPADFLPLLSRINLGQLTTDAVRAAQGSAGIKAIYDQIRAQVLP